MYNYIKNRLPLFTFVSVIFIIGVAFGAIAVKTVDYNVKQSVFSQFNDFIKGFNKLKYDHKSLISESIKFNLFNIAIIWAFGMTVFLMPLVTLLIFFKGFVLGFTTGFLISEYSYKGIIIVLATVFPQNLLIIPAYIISGVMAIYISIRIIKYYRGLDRLNFQDFVVYSLQMGFLALVMTGGSFLETYVSPLLFKLVLRFIT